MQVEIAGYFSVPCPFVLKSIVVGYLKKSLMQKFSFLHLKILEGCRSGVPFGEDLIHFSYE